MNGRLLLIFGLVGLAVAGTKSYTVTLLEPASVGSTQLKAGSYKVDVEDQMAVIHNGKVKSEVPVKAEEAPAKYNQTTVVVTLENGSQHLREIHLGGTRTKLVLTDNATATH